MKPFRENSWTLKNQHVLRVKRNPLRSKAYSIIFPQEPMTKAEIKKAFDYNH